MCCFWHFCSVGDEWRTEDEANVAVLRDDKNTAFITIPAGRDVRSWFVSETARHLPARSESEPRPQTPWSPSPTASPHQPPNKLMGLRWSLSTVSMGQTPDLHDRLQLFHLEEANLGNLLCLSAVAVGSDIADRIFPIILPSAPGWGWLSPTNTSTSPLGWIT